MRRAILVLAVWLGMAAAGAAQIPVVATSAVLSDIALNVGGDQLAVTTIIPAGFCPAHYDLKPSDILALSQAKLVLYHGFEPWVKTLLENVNPGTQVVAVRGPWNTPPALIDRIGDVTAALSEVRPELAGLFEKRAAGYREEVAALGKELSARAEELHLESVPAIVMLWQKDFASWLGLEVVATYPPEERLSLKDLAQLVATGKKEGVRLVIDNLQSGVSFGARLARELGAVHVVLTNFPGALPGAVDLLSMLKVNAEQIFTALKF